MLNGIAEDKPETGPFGPDDALSTYGALSLLASSCPLHSTFSQQALNRIFLPAIEHKAVRLFWAKNGKPCAALIWARLSDNVALRMFTENRTPKPGEWHSGHHLWFLDLIAPFGHGKHIARHLCRTPPKEAFSFARLGPDGRLRKLIEVQASGPARRPFHAYFADEPRDN